MLSEEAAHREALKNAEFQEWMAIRVLFSKLARTTMSAAEVGVRISAILRHNPSLMVEGAKGVQTSGIGGDGGDETRLSPDLLPLPIPPFKLFSEKDIEQAFGSGSSRGKGAYAAGTQAWTILVIGTFRGHGSFSWIWRLRTAESFFCGLQVTSGWLARGLACLVAQPPEPGRFPEAPSR